MFNLNSSDLASPSYAFFSRCWFHYNQPSLQNLSSQRFVLRFCVCCIHEEFKRLLHVLKKDSMVAHESCTCTCGFCADGNCKVVFESDMDLYWCMRHLLCPPAKLYSQTSRNLFPPRYCLSSHSSFINGFLLLRLPSVCSCLDGRCSNTSQSQIKIRLYNSRQHRTHKCNSRAKPLNLF